MKLKAPGKPSTHLAETIWASVLAIVLYSMWLAPMGPATNGGGLGLAFLSVGAFLAWRALYLNRNSPKVRWLVRLPLASFITVLIARDGMVQMANGWTWGI